MKTPLQELIEYLETWMIDDKYVQDNPMKYEEYMVQHANQMVQVKEHFIRLCKSMLEQEKGVMCEFAYKCYKRHKVYGDFITQDYYNETFNTNEK
jgi:hypothetical protein